MPRTARLLLRFTSIVLGGAVVVAVVVALLLPQFGRLPEAASFEPLSKLVLPELPEPSILYDTAGDPFGQLQGSENRQIVGLEAVSEEMRATVLAVEDANFYEHDGVSARSVLRALRANSDAGEVEQGGSTITQQLVKILLVGNEQSIARKAREASLALQLENQFCDGIPKRDCKDAIFEQYLNAIYLGRGAYGVEAGAQVYFGKSAAELGWAEAAVLTSLIRSPTGYDPIRFPEVARDRRRIVVDRLLGTGNLNPDGANLVNAAPLPTQAFGRPAAAETQDLTYIERKVRDELLQAEWLAPTPELRRYLIFNGGLKITTTIDPKAQELAEAAAEDNPLRRRNPDTAVAIAAVEPSTGAVRAIVGEYTTPDGRPIEIAAGPGLGRQAGSAFKPFTLVAAIEEGYPITSRLSGAPAPNAQKKLWGVPLEQSYPADCKTKGTVELSKALAQSNNCVFMRLQGVVGFEKVKRTAEKLGIGRSLDPNDDRAACFAIGCGANVYPIDMANAYGTIANDGRRNPAHFVTRVEDRTGAVLFEFEPVNEQVITVDTARQSTVAMQQVITAGTYSGGRLPQDRPAAGKTGTMEVGGGANTDVWFIGYTPQLSTAVWIGRPLDSTKNLVGGRVQGGVTSAVVWRNFMAPYLDGAPVVRFTPPRSVPRGKTIADPWTGRNASGSDSSAERTSRSSRSGSSGSGTTRRSTTVPRSNQPSATTPTADASPRPPSSDGDGGDADEGAAAGP
jgi:penicillin-binding protein 1A